MVPLQRALHTLDDLLASFLLIPSYHVRTACIRHHLGLCLGGEYLSFNGRSSPDNVQNTFMFQAAVV